MLLDRLKTELHAEKEWISRKLQSWHDLTYRPKGGDDRRLSSDAMKWVEFQIDTVDTHLRVARGAFAEYFAAQNTWIMFWLTVIVVILTVFQVVTNKDIAGWVGATLKELKSWIVILWP
jgi:hypothetical protein